MQMQQVGGCEYVTDRVESSEMQIFPTQKSQKIKCRLSHSLAPFTHVRSLLPHSYITFRHSSFTQHKHMLDQNDDAEKNALEIDSKQRR